MLFYMASYYRVLIAVVSKYFPPHVYQGCRYRAVDKKIIFGGAIMCRDRLSGFFFQSNAYTAKTMVCISYQKYALCNTQSMKSIL